MKVLLGDAVGVLASMKTLPKRKGNPGLRGVTTPGGSCLNESPSQKEGKFILLYDYPAVFQASMKALPRRKGNAVDENDLTRL